MGDETLLVFECMIVAQLSVRLMHHGIVDGSTNNQPRVGRQRRIYLPSQVVELF